MLVEQLKLHLFKLEKNIFYQFTEESEQCHVTSLQRVKSFNEKVKMGVGNCESYLRKKNPLKYVYCKEIRNVNAIKWRTAIKCYT